MQSVYADNNATTQVDPEVLEVMRPFFEAEFYNPSSMYDASKPAAEAVDQARKTVARFLGCNSQDMLFTSCASESNNTAIFGAVRANRQRNHIVTTSVEHPAVLEVCKELDRAGFDVTFLRVDPDGQIKMREFVRALRPDTLLVSVMHANNETGVIFPIEGLSRITKETDPSILFHTDATQTVGKLPINLKRSLKHVDLLSFSGHKMHGPKGIGGLFIRRGTPVRPLLIGGHQEDGRRAGTENVAFIAALAKACEVAEKHIADEERVRGLRDRLQAELIAKISHLEVNGGSSPRLPNTVNVAVHYVEGEGMLFQLSEQGIYASSGSACTSGSLEPSHVLRAMDVPFTAMHGSIRFSLSRFNTEADVDRIAGVFPEIVQGLRKASPYWDSDKNEPRRDVQIG